MNSEIILLKEELKKINERRDFVLNRLEKIIINCKHVASRDKEWSTCLECGIPLRWTCKKSPDGVCHYSASAGKIELIDKSLVDAPRGIIEYDDYDACIYCGESEERK